MYSSFFSYGDLSFEINHQGYIKHFYDFLFRFREA